MAIKIYTVRAGDSVYQIARANGTTPAAIVSANGLQNADQILVGQALIIPSSAISNVVVQAGEALWQIAQRFGVTLQALLGANPQITNPNLIQIGQMLRLPRPGQRDIVINGYCYPTIREEALDEALPHMSMLTVFSAQARANGNLVPMQADARAIERAKAANVRPHMAITNIENDKFSADLAKALLADPAAQAKLLQNCVDVMKEKGYTGLDIDFEYVPGESREALNCFLAKARAWMHDEGFLLTSAVESLTQDNQTGSLYAAFDFAAQGKYNDFVTLMTYDWGYQSGPPMAVAPINEVRRVLEYAVTRIPREKILMGIPNYGYDWKIPFQQGTMATVVTNPGALTIAARYGADISFDERAQTPWFRYQEPGGQRHEVWFEDARSIYAKLELAKEFGIAGVSYWTVNNSFPQNWTLVEDMFRVKRV